MHASARRCDVAKAAGVSESTVSRALNDSPRISRQVKDLVRAVARQLGYVPDVQARHFAQRRSCRLGFVVRTYKRFTPFSRIYFPTLLDGIVMGAERRGYSVTIVLDRDASGQRDLVQVVRSKLVDGLLIPVSPIDDKRIDDLLEARVPFVLINDYRPDCHSVDSRPHAGMRSAFEHMIASGHHRFGFVTGDTNYRNARDRLDAFRSLASGFGVEVAIASGDFSRTSGYRAAGKLLQAASPPSAIMTSSDREALGVIDYCREHQIDVPGAVSVIGYDNLFPAGEISPSLTAIDNPIQHAGGVAAERIINILENGAEKPTTTWLDTGFVQRQSSGPFGGGRGV